MTQPDPQGARALAERLHSRFGNVYPDGATFESDAAAILGDHGLFIADRTQYDADLIAANNAALAERVRGLTAEHRRCGPKYEGCYAHFPTPHCRADGMAWPCDVDTIRLDLLVPTVTTDQVPPSGDAVPELEKA